MAGRIESDGQLLTGSRKKRLDGRCTWTNVSCFTRLAEHRIWM